MPQSSHARLGFSRGRLIRSTRRTIGCARLIAANQPATLQSVDFTDKVGGAFSTGGGEVGGKEHVVTSLLLFMLSNRMIVAGPLFRNDKTGSVWGEPGSSAMTGPLDPGVSEQELDSARRLGERIARIVHKVKAR